MARSSNSQDDAATGSEHFASATRADETLLAHARRSLIEIPTERLREEGNLIVDELTGDRFEIRTAFVEWASVTTQGPMVVAFSLSADGYLFPLVPESGNRQREELIYMGSLDSVGKLGAASRPLVSGLNIR